MLRGKAALLMLGLAAGIILVVPACKKDDKESTQQQAVSQAEANEVVSSAISGSVVSQTTMAAGIAAGFGGQGAKTAECGFSFEGETGPMELTYNDFKMTMDYAYSYIMTCAADSATPKALAFKFDGKTSITGSKVSASDTSSANFSITGLDDKSTTLVFNQDFNHKGNYTSKSGGASFSNKLIYKAADIQVNKTTYQIVSGKAAVEISGVTTDGKKFDYKGQITFSGNNKATFAITGGSTFELKLK